MNFKNMSIKKSLIVGFGTTIVVSVIIIIVSLVLMNVQKDQYTDILNRYVRADELVSECRIDYNIAARNLRDVALSGNTDALTKVTSGLAELDNRISELENVYPLENKKPLTDFTSTVREWESEANNIASVVRTDQIRAAEMIVSICTPKLDEAAAAGSALADEVLKAQEDIIGRQNTTSTVAMIVIAVVMVIVTLIVLMMAAKIIKSIVDPSAQVRNALVGFSQGDLSVPVEFTGKNELGTMCDALRTSQNILGECIGDTCRLLEEMGAGNFDVRTKDEKIYVGSLSRILASLRVINRSVSDDLTQIGQSSDEVAAGADQVSIGAQSLAQGATEQASAVQELSATIADISENAKKTAAVAEQAGQSVNEAGDQITTSVEYVRQLNVARENISSSSQEISKIITTIEDIAFQTNILALNAAVEAARAGSAGKGFAVVADEVRQLANKSDQAAKATKELIDGSINAVREGAEAAGKVTSSLEQTAELAGGVTTMMSTVVEAVENQTQAIMQVTEGIDQISAVVQTNSATSEESAAASEELSSQATLMKGLLSRFKLRQVGYVGSHQVQPSRNITPDVDDRSSISTGLSPFSSTKY